MKKEIQTILNDLYALDESLKANEKELIKLIEKLLSVKPDLEINKEFARSLRAQLMERAGESDKVGSTDYFGFIKRLIFPFAGGVLTTVLVVGLIYYGNMKSVILPSENDGVVTALEDEAFGPLSNIARNSVPAAVQNTGGGENFAKNDMAVTESGSLAPSVADTAPAPEESMKIADAPQSDVIEINNISARAENAPRATGMGGGGSAVSMPAVDAKMIAPYIPEKYKYVYKGDPVELKENKIAVYRRTTGALSDDSVINAAKSFGFGAIDLLGFNGLTAQNFSMIQNVKNGYNINIDFTSQSISIYQNWAQWEQPFDKCAGDQECIEKLQLKPKDVPSDDKIISISDAFLKEHSVDTSSYGQPVVMRYWENQTYDNGGQIYIGDEIQVIYPLRINGMLAVGEGGDPYGLSVSVNIRQKKVSNISNIRVNDFESSEYDAVTDFNEVTKFAESGGLSYFYGYQEGTKTVDVEIGNPEKVIEVINRMDKEKGGVYSEYFVPALKFPINKKPGSFVYQNYIIVPLAKDMLKRDEPVAMPLTRTEPAIAPQGTPVEIK